MGVPHTMSWHWLTVAPRSVSIAAVYTLVLMFAGALRLQAQAEVLPAAGLSLYVSTEGNDAWTGRRQDPNGQGTDGPFATLQRARDEIRHVKEATGLPTGGILVLVAGGRYELTGPLLLDAQDAGSADSPIAYCRLGTEEVRISGGKRITDWQPVRDAAILDRLPPEARAHVVQANLGALGITEYGDYSVDVEHALQRRVARADGQGEYTMGSVPAKPDAVSPARMELFVNDQPMQIARGPNGSALTIEETLGEHKRVVRGHSSSVEGVFRYEGDYPKRWVGEKHAYVCGSWCRDWAEQRHRIKTLDPEKRVIEVEKPYHYYGYHKGQWFYGFNILAELDQPGEWYVDRDSGILYLWPTSPIATATVEVSMAPSLIQLTDVSHVTIRGLTFEATRGTAISLDKSSKCRVEGCTIRNLGMHAVTVTDGTENGILGCDMYGMGAGGIYLVAGDRKTLVPTGHYAENNHIHHYGRWDRMYRPAIVFSGVGLRASHNLIHDAPHSAIIFGGNDHLIEYNEIHSVCYDANDCGAIYTGRDWTIRGHVIRYNYLHHLYGRAGHACRGVYLDDSFAAATLTGNIFYQVTYAIFLGGGRDNTFENNVFVDCPMALQIDARGLGWQSPHLDGRLKEATTKQTLRGIRFLEPPYSTRYPQLLTLLQDDPKYPKGNTFRRNIFWPGSGEDLRRVAKGGDPGENWWDRIAPQIRELVRMENNLVNEDPKFVDEKAGNFQLRPDSPAWKLGFERIPVEKIGLYRDPLRASWPAVHTPRPMPPTQAAPKQPPAPAKRSARTGPPPVFEVQRTDKPITIDGTLQPTEWNGLDQQHAMVIGRGVFHEPVSPESRAWFGHDERYLYAAIENEVNPDKPLVTDRRWAGSDAIELALRNPSQSDAPIFALRGYPDGRFESSGEPGTPAKLVQQAAQAVTFAASVRDAKTWTAEYRIPLSLLGLAPAGKGRLECNVSVRKIAGPGWAMWQGTGTKTWDTPKAGLLELTR